MLEYQSAVSAIRSAYTELGHDDGWIFLYSSAQTLRPSTQIVFAGLNPGSGRVTQEMESTEEGNAHRIARWDGKIEMVPLQDQICGLFKSIAAKCEDIDPDMLMDSTLTGNLCPFRSSSWEEIHNKKKSLAFSRQLWSQILDYVNPSVLICMTDQTTKEFSRISRTAGWKQESSLQGSVGWGPVKYAMKLLNRDGDERLIVRIPHLSRFRIVGRRKSRPAIDHIVTEVSRRIDVGKLLGNL